MRDISITISGDTVFSNIRARYHGESPASGPANRLHREGEKVVIGLTDHCQPYLNRRLCARVVYESQFHIDVSHGPILADFTRSIIFLPRARARLCILFNGNVWRIFRANRGWQAPTWRIGYVSSLALDAAALSFRSVCPRCVLFADQSEISRRRKFLLYREERADRGF